MWLDRITLSAFIATIVGATMAGAYVRDGMPALALVGAWWYVFKSVLDSVMFEYEEEE